MVNCRFISLLLQLFKKTTSWVCLSLMMLQPNRLVLMFCGKFTNQVFSSSPQKLQSPSFSDKWQERKLSWNELNWFRSPSSSCYLFQSEYWFFSFVSIFVWPGTKIEVRVLHFCPFLSVLCYLFLAPRK